VGGDTDIFQTWIFNNVTLLPGIPVVSNSESTQRSRVLLSKNWNIGLTGLTHVIDNIKYEYATPINVFSDIQWTGLTAAGYTNSDMQPMDTAFPVTVHPYIDDISKYIYKELDGVKLIDPSTVNTMPLKILFRLDDKGIPNITFPSSITTTPFIYRKVRIFLELENSSRAFEFEITFKLSRNRTYTVRTV
jgi:hypothetical protein